MRDLEQKSHHNQIQKELFVFCTANLESNLFWKLEIVATESLLKQDGTMHGKYKLKKKKENGIFIYIYLQKHVGFVAL
jgi:hypothetical protein